MCITVARVYLLLYHLWGGKQAPNVHFSFLIQLCVKVMGLKLLIHVSLSVSKLACPIQTEIIRHWSNLEESNWSATLYDDGCFAFTCKLSGHCKEGPGIHLKTITKCYPFFLWNCRSGYSEPSSNNNWVLLLKSLIHQWNDTLYLTKFMRPFVRLIVCSM